MAPLPLEFHLKLGKSQILKIESQLVRAAIATNTGLNALANSEYLKAFKMLNPSFQLSGKTSLRTTVFEQVSRDERKKVLFITAAVLFLRVSMLGLLLDIRKMVQCLCYFTIFTERKVYY